MMGMKKLSEIRAEIPEAFARDGKDIAWVEEQLRNLRKEPKVDEHDKHVLLALKGALEKPVRKTKRPSSSSAKKKSRSAS